jgi:uncharacterized membrane protein
LKKEFSKIVRAFQNVLNGTNGNKIVENQSNKIKNVVEFNKDSSEIKYNSNYYFSKEDLKHICECCTNNLSTDQKDNLDQAGILTDFYAQEHIYRHPRNLNDSLLMITGYAEGSQLFTEHQVDFIEYILTELEAERLLTPGLNFYEFGICFVDLLQWKEIYHKLFDKDINNNLAFDGWMPHGDTPYFSLSFLYSIFGVFMHYGLLKKEHSNIIRCFDRNFWNGYRNETMVERNVSKFNIIAKIDEKTGESYIDSDSNGLLCVKSIEVINSDIERHKKYGMLPAVQ